ncbi:MAG: dTDP-4-dehydrorhamnose reductase [Dysgonamonadaceae bacterium]|jgi:dTDP-4-dehydrorhamnose reductase|nr:dTDP-4-dehydrorhamnose reductase [Dysgonamonadaceae bacterium]
MAINILLTGANGQLGLEICKIATRYHEFTLFPTDVDTLNICKQAAVERFVTGNSIDYIINCAAYTAVDKAESDTDTCFAINCDAVGNLASAGRAKIIHISTDYVFDGQGNRPIKETDAASPQSVYGASKLAGEKLLQTISRNTSIIIRTAWLYSSFGSNFVKTMIRLGQERDSLNVVNDQFGTPTSASSLAQAIMEIISFNEKHSTFPSGIYHFTDEGVCTWYDFCLEIHKLAGITSCRVNPVPSSDYPSPAKRPAYSVLDKTKIKNTFKLEIPQWEDSLQQCITLLNEIN